MFLDEQRRSYLDHMRIEHRRLHQMLNETRSAISSGDAHDEAAPTFCQIVRLLRQLDEELRRHFSEEEAGGCMEEAVCHCPSLSTDAKQIASEHPVILAELKDLIERVQKLPANSKNRRAIGQEIDRLSRRLQIHEASENRLLSRGLGIAANDTARLDAPEFRDE